jgi:hypothetical protein
VTGLAASVERYGPCAEVSDPRPGDFILVRGSSLVSRVIYASEKRRALALRRYGYWSHCALVAASTGLIIDVTSRGVVVRHISRYRGDEYHYVRVDRPERERIQSVVVAARAVGEPYDVLSFFRIGWNLVVRRPRMSAPDRGQQVCASVVARALAHTGVEFASPPHEMMAADLACHFGVLP